MSIQECIFVLGSIIFIVALLPSVYSKNKPDTKTSLMTGTVLTVFGVTYISMDFYFAAVTSLVTAALWFTLYTQKKVEKNVT